MDLTALIPLAIGWLPTCWNIINDTAIIGAVKESAKDYTELLAKIFFKKETALKSMAELQKDPANLKEQGKLEVYLEEILENNSELRKHLEEVLKKLEANAGSVNIIKSKNVVNNSHLNAAGNIQIGDNK